MSDKKIMFAWATDWVALYIDGKLAIQGTSIREDVLLRAIGVDYEYKEINDDWLTAVKDCCPKDLDKIVWEEDGDWVPEKDNEQRN